jgi:predicted phosphodiesterase
MTQYANPIQGYVSEAALSGWTESWNAAVANPLVVGDATLDGIHILLDKTGSDGRYFLSWDTPGNVDDVELLVKIRGVATGDEAARVYIRGGATLKLMAYLRPNVNAVRIGWYNGTTFTQLGVINMTIDPNVWYWVRFRAVGTAIKCRVWADGSSEPGTWGLEVTDGNVTAAAPVGIGTYYGDVLCSYISVGTGGDSAPDPPALTPLANSADLYVDTVNGSSANAGTSWETALDTLRNAIAKLPAAADGPCTIHVKGSDIVPAKLTNKGFTEAFPITIKVDVGDSYILTAAVSASGVLIADAPWLTLDGVEIYNNVASPAAGSAGIYFDGTAAGDELTFNDSLNCIFRGGQSAVRNISRRCQYMKNVLAYGASVQAILHIPDATVTWPIMWLDNVTAIGATYGVNCNPGLVKARNSYAYGTTTAWQGPYRLQLTNCAANDSSGTEGLDSIALDTNNFTDPENDDYTLPLGSALIDAGLVLSDAQSRAYINVSSVVQFQQSRSVGTVLELVNSSSVATVRFRDFENAAWLGARTFNLGFAFSGTSTKIAIISDIHMGTTECDEVADFDAAIADLDSLGDIDAVFVLGDIANSGASAEYDAYLTSKAASDVSVWKELSGNHDQGEYFLSKLSYTDRYYSHTIGNVVFIFLGDEDGAGGISAAAQTFLNTTLTNNQDKNCIILSHEGRYNRNDYTTVAESYLDPAATISGIIDNKDWQAWFSAHSHGYVVNYSYLVTQKAGPFSFWQSFTEATDIVGTARGSAWCVGAYERPSVAPAGADWFPFFLRYLES